MFCEKCGKELKDGWNKCPYCGQAIGESSVKTEKKPETPSHSQTAQGERNYTGDVPKKKQKSKKILLGVGAVLLLLFAVAILTPSGDDSSNSSQETKEASEEIKTLEEAGGFGQWKEDGFPGMVRANISVDFPLGNTDKNNYAVYIGMGGVNVGIIMQEDEKSVKEWEWLINAEPNEDTGKAYFNGILKYLGEREEMPVFIISDVVEGDYKADSQDMGNEEDAGDTELDLEDIMGLPETELEGMGFSYDEDNMGYTLAGGDILVNSGMDGNVYLIMVEGTGSDIPGFHGVRIGMSLEEADKLLADRYTKEVEREGVTMDDSTGYLDRESGNSIILSYADGKVTKIFVMHLTEEELQEALNTENAEKLDSDIENQEENDLHITGDFDKDVANGVLYGKDGKIVDFSGNFLQDYAIYSVIEEGYIFDGEDVIEGYYVDSTGKVVLIPGFPGNSQGGEASTGFDQIQNAINMAQQVDIETLMRSPSTYNNTSVCIGGILCVDGFFDNFYVSGNGETIRVFPAQTVDESGNHIEKLLSGDNVIIVGGFKYQDYYHEYLGEKQSTIDNAIVILLD